MHHHVEGDLTTRDCKRHVPVRFTVPADCAAMDIRFHYDPYLVRDFTNLLTLTLFDPEGFRGAGHRGGETQEVHLDAAAATPGYLPRRIRAGEWIAEIDTHMIMPGTPVHYSLDVRTTGDDGAQTAAAPAPGRRARAASSRGAGWYRGDLHSHTCHSDAAGRPVSTLIRMARDAGLDFVFLTDHNTVSGLAEMDAAVSGDLLTVGGIELSTFWGHALCLGTRDWVDWRVRPGTGGMRRIAAAAEEQGHLFVIAHPQSFGDPCCTGCTWRYGEMMPGNARMVEIWNGPWKNDPTNEASLSLWYDWLNSGFRLAATAGSDSHDEPYYLERTGFNVVYAEALTEAAILTALRAGHSYISAGPRLSFQAAGDDGGRWMCGDTVDGPATFSAEWSDCPTDAQLCVVVNGKPLAKLPSGARGRHDWRMAPADADWALVELRGLTGELLAIANPIFLAEPSGQPLPK
jgi:hypothetical protein